MNALPEKVEEQPESDTNLAAVSEVEAGIREFVRNDIAYLRRPGISALGEADQDTAVTNVNSLIQRVAGASLSEIENLITELERLRDMLHNEGQRVQREIAGYAQLSHAAMKSTRIIAENMTQWKSANDLVKHG
jgi:hypothetical protein